MCGWKVFLFGIDERGKDGNKCTDKKGLPEIEPTIFLMALRVLAVHDIGDGEIDTGDMADL